MADYPSRFLAWLAKRKPEVQARILRLNPAPIHDGVRLRGYHPHKRSYSPWKGNPSKGMFIAKYGREAWARLPRCAIEHDGHRKSVTRESVFDNLWMLPDDSPLRQARKENGLWVIPPPN